MSGHIRTRQQYYTSRNGVPATQKMNETKYRAFSYDVIAAMLEGEDNTSPLENKIYFHARTVSSFQPTNMVSDRLLCAGVPRPALLVTVLYSRIIVSSSVLNLWPPNSNKQLLEVKLHISFLMHGGRCNSQ